MELSHRTVYVLYALAGLIALGVFSLVGYNGLYGQDAYAYFLNAHQFSEYFSGDGPMPFTFFPPVYAMLSGAAMCVKAEPVACQAISIAALVVACICLYEVLVFKVGQNAMAAGYVMLCGFLSPYFFRVGVACMSDSLALMFISAALFACCRFETSFHVRWLVGAFLLAGLAAFTRYVAALPLVIVFGFYAYQHHTRVSLRQVAAAVTASVLLLLPVVYFAMPSFTTHGTNNELFRSLSAAHIFGRCFQVKGVADACYQLPNVLFNLLPFVHPGFVSMSAVLLFFFRRQDFGLMYFRMWLAVVLGCLIFLMCIPNQNPRHQLIVFPFLLLVYYKPYLRFIGFVTGKLRGWVVYATLVAIQLMLVYRATALFVTVSKEDRAISEITEREANGIVVYEFAASAMLQTYVPDVKHFSIFDSAVTQIPCSSLLLVHPHLVTRDWKDRLPEQNFTRLMQQCDTVQLAPQGMGWKLYKLKNRSCKP